MAIRGMSQSSLLLCCRKQNLNLARLGISGTYTAWDLWSGATSTISGTTWTISLGSRQAKLFRLGSGITTAAGPTKPISCHRQLGDLPGVVASGTPPFTYTWMKNGAVLPGQDENSITPQPD